jgi:hypothetical protein
MVAVGYFDGGPDVTEAQTDGRKAETDSPDFLIVVCVFVSLEDLSSPTHSKKHLVTG